jgi:hypothetical protein
MADQGGRARNLVQKWRNRFALYEPRLMAEEGVEAVARLAALQEVARAGRPPAFSPAGPPYRRRGRLPRR